MFSLGLGDRCSQRAERLVTLCAVRRRGAARETAVSVGGYCPLHFHSIVYNNNIQPSTPENSIPIRHLYLRGPLRCGRGNVLEQGKQPSVSTLGLGDGRADESDPSFCYTRRTLSCPPRPLISRATVKIHAWPPTLRCSTTAIAAC